MIVFFAAIVEDLGEEVGEDLGSKNVSDSFAQSADTRTTTSSAMVRP
jgi:hypothetical protein